MKTPFEELGLRAWAEPEEIRAAYRALVKQCHPDMVRDPEKKEEAQQRMIRLNLAYEEALRLATPRQHAAYVQELPKGEAVILAEKMLARDNPGAVPGGPSGFPGSREAGSEEQRLPQRGAGCGSGGKGREDPGRQVPEMEQRSEEKMTHPSRGRMGFMEFRGNEARRGDYL